MNEIPIYSIDLPEYKVDTQPDHVAIGKRIDAIIKQHFMDQEVIIRCLGSGEHPGKTIDQVIEIIQQTGTDRYDPNRTGDRYENVDDKQIDFFGLPFRVDENGSIMEQFIESFYTWPLQSRGYPVRVDIVIMYDPKQVKQVVHTYDDGRTKDDGYVFMNPERKSSALIAVIKLTP